MRVSKQGFFLVVGLLLLSGCTLGADAPDHYRLTLSSPVLDRSSRALLGPRTREEFQAQTSYPVGLWLQEIRVDCHPPHAVERVEIRYLHPERHYQKLGMKVGAPLLFQVDSPQTFRLPEKQGIPIRSNEPLMAEVVWRKKDPYAKPFQAQCKIELRWASSDESKILAVRSTSTGEIPVSYVLDTSFQAWPTTLR